MPNVHHIHSTLNTQHSTLWHTVLRTILVLCTLMLVACHDEVDKPKTSRRTVIVYMAADNNLGTSGFANLDIREMIDGSASIPSDCRLIVYCDKQANSCIYEIRNNKMQTLYTYADNQCSASTEVLSDVIRRATTLAPAASYGLVLWSHASAWLPGSHDYHDAQVRPIERSVLQEDHIVNNKRQYCSMSIDELASTLVSAPHLDFLMFDACFMQSIECDYALRHTADYIIASPAEIPNRGGTYTQLLPAMFATTFNADELARAYYKAEDEYWHTYDGQRGGGIVMSAVRTSQLDSLARVTHKLINGQTPTPDATDQHYWLYRSGSMRFPDIVDLQSIMSHYASSPHYAEWQQQLARTVTSCYATRYWDSECSNFEYYHYNVYYGYRGEIYDLDAICGLNTTLPDERYNNTTWNDDLHATQWWRAILSAE